MRIRQFCWTPVWQLPLPSRFAQRPIRWAYSGFRSNEKSVLNFRPISIGFLSLPILIRAKTAVRRLRLTIRPEAFTDTGIPAILSLVFRCFTLSSSESDGYKFFKCDIVELVTDRLHRDSAVESSITISKCIDSALRYDFYCTNCSIRE